MDPTTNKKIRHIYPGLAGADVAEELTKPGLMFTEPHTLCHLTKVIKEKASQVSELPVLEGDGGKVTLLLLHPISRYKFCPFPRRQS